MSHLRLLLCLCQTPFLGKKIEMINRYILYYACVDSLILQAFIVCSPFPTCIGHAVSTSQIKLSSQKSR